MSVDIFSDIATQIKQIKISCREILQKTVDLMKKLQPNSSLCKYIEMEIGIKLPEDAQVSKETNSLIECIRNVSFKFVTTAQLILNEIDIFASTFCNHTSLENEENCEFMKTVWYGDRYGESELDGLRELNRDLNNQIKDINQETLVENVREYMIEHNIGYNVNQEETISSKLSTAKIENNLLLSNNNNNNNNINNNE